MSNKQKFKGKTLYRKRVIDNILKVYNDETFIFGLDWYEDANEYAHKLAKLHNVDVRQVCGIIAALSPLKSWSENKRITELFLSSGKKLHVQNFHDKAISILTNVDVNDDYIVEVLNGNKITNFYFNIAYPGYRGAVTIDRHAISIAIGRSIKHAEGIGVTEKQYNFFKLCYIEVGRLLEVRPSSIQSVTWEKWRKLKQLQIN